MSLVTQLFVTAAIAGGGAQAIRDLGPAGSPSVAGAALIRAPNGFVENKGQWPTDTRFVAAGSNLVARADEGGLWIEGLASRRGDEAIDRAVFRLSFEGPSSDVELRADGPLPGTRNYLIGNDPAAWRTGLVAHSTLVWVGVRPGVDFVLQRGTGRAFLEYALRCAPGTGERPLNLHLEGADELDVDADGSLVARTSAGVLRQDAPRAWELGEGGEQHERMARFALVGAGRFTIEVEGRDEARALVVDPGLEWAGYIGGQFIDVAEGLALTSADEPVVAGRTISMDFPTTPGVIQPLDQPDYDAFAMKVSADGAGLVFATFLGGSARDWGWDVAVRPNGNVIVGGRVESGDFPLTPGAFDTQLDGVDGFVLELRADGSALKFSTLLGGTGLDQVQAIELHPDGSIATTGQTSSADFPATSSGAQPGYGGGAYDAFVATLAADGTAIIAATYLGGAGEESVNDVALHDDGSVIVGGECRGPGFPVTPGAFDPTFSPITPLAWAGTVARLGPSLSSLVFATYLDGSGGSHVYAVATKHTGEVVVAGQVSGSSVFPATSGAFDASHSGVPSGFVAALTPDGTALAFASFDGSAADSNARALHVDDAGVITIGGDAFGDPFPTTPGAFDSSVGAFPAPDAYVMRFKPDGSALLYSTLMGEVGWEESFRMTLDRQGRAIVLGNVLNDSFPMTPGSFDGTYGGCESCGYDEGFLAEVEMQPMGVTAFGAPTEACKGPIRLTALHVPQAGNGAFSIACTGAPPGAIGILGLSGGSLPGGFPLLGASVYLDVTQPIVLKGATADALGYDEIPLPIPPTAAGVQFFAQAAWLDTGGCGGGLVLSASDALQIDVSGP